MKQKPKAVFLDVGCWQTSKGGQPPTMTFALIEHSAEDDAIALCSYYFDSDDFNKKNKQATNLGKNFGKSLINKFISAMMLHKYGRMAEYDGYLNIKAQHVRELIRFDPGTFRSNIDCDKLIILIPDLHLHYFKGTCLDNFVSYYKEIWPDGDNGPPVSMPTESVESMENDFGKFLQSIKTFQYLNKSVSTQVIFLGDLVEMWETRFVFSLYLNGLLDINKQEIYDYLRTLIEAVRIIYSTGAVTTLWPSLKKHDALLKRILELRLPSNPLSQEAFEDIELRIQLGELDKDEIEKIYIPRDAPQKMIHERSLRLRDEILKKYKLTYNDSDYDENGKNYIYNDFEKNMVEFPKIMEDFKVAEIQVDFLLGNHDSFPYMVNFEGIDSLRLSDPEVCADALPPVDYDGADIVFTHGHRFDMFNGDEAFFLGYLLTGFNTLFEGIKQGDLPKELERSFLKDSKDDLEKIFKVFWGWQYSKLFRNRQYAVKNVIYIQAHSHRPCLKDVTKDYRTWLCSSKSTGQKPVKKCIRINTWPELCAWLELMKHLAIPDPESYLRIYVPSFLATMPVPRYYTAIFSKILPMI